MNQTTITEQQLFRYFLGESTNRENKLILSWLDQSKENRVEFAILKKIYIEIMMNFDHSANTDVAYKRFLDEIENRRSFTVNSGTRRRVLRPLMRYAGILVLLFSVGLAAYYFGIKSERKSDNQNFEIAVPRGANSSVVLPDGSSIWLNAGSFLRYSKNFDYETREVFLEGEALFEVKKSPYPFIVHTTHLDIYVHGTTFNVKSYPGENQVEATLIEGNIRVETRSTNKSVYIKPHQKLIYQKKLNITEIISNEESKDEESKDEGTAGDKEVVLANNLILFNNVDIEETVSWQTGTLIINNETLESLVKKLERKWDVHFVFENEDLKQQSYSGKIPDFPIEQVLKAIALTSPVAYTIHEKTIHLAFNENFDNNNR